MMIDNFIRYIADIRRYSQRTVASYRNNLLSFSSWLNSQQLDEGALRPRDINNYIAALMERGLKPNSINQYLASIRSYFDYCCRFENMGTNPAAGVRDVRAPKLLPRYIPGDKMDYLIDNLLPKDTFKRFRTRIVILIFYHTGIRCQELANLKFNDIDINNMYLRVVGKRDKERIIPFGKELAEEIALYRYSMACAIDSNCMNVVQTINGEACTAYQIRQICKLALRRIVPEELAHPHILRHTFATVLMNNGAKIENVRMLLGHASIQTTAIYQHVSINYLRDTYSQIFNK